MTTRIRTLNFLPEVFKTPTNAQFLNATLDQIVSQPAVRRVEGYIGSKLGYGINAKDFYVTEPTKARTDYQLDPGVVITKPDESVAKDFISYPGMLDCVKSGGGITDNNSRLFKSQIYSWDSFTDLDKIINFNQYYWLPDGPEAVTVASDTIFSTTDYLVTDVVNGYQITPLGQSGGALNPTLTLLRGGTYRFSVNQLSQFWIQGAPGVTGFDPTQPNIQTRDVLGVENNGATNGLVTFTVPSKDAQNEYNFPGNNIVDVVSSLPFSQINGARVSELGSIDSITSLDGLTVMFYETGIPNEVGYVSKFYDSTTYDNNGGFVSPLTIEVTGTSSVGNLITCDSTANLTVNSSITFSGIPFGNLATGTIYYVLSIDSATEFTISESIGGSAVVLTTSAGTMTGNINQGLFEEGYYTNVNQYFYRITYVGDISDPVISLTPDTEIPVNQKITARFGSTYISRNFYKSTAGNIVIYPYLSAILDTLYYQDGTSDNKVGVIRLIESNVTNTIDVETDILGKSNYTAPNGVVFTNGLKVEFAGSIVPESYLTGEYYVEGVGTAIELIPVDQLIAPEPFTVGNFIPYDTTPYDIGNYDSNLYIPITPDYITIARNSINKNAWSRSNRWFHIDVINATAQYNNNPELATLYATAEAKAKRPIIEFYPNLALFNSGVIGKNFIDFIDFRTTDAFSQVAGQENYYPDVTAYSTYSASITGVTANIVTSASDTSATGNVITCSSTSGFHVNDKVVFTGTVFGGVVNGSTYYINSIIDSTHFTISTEQDGDIFVLSTASGTMTVTVTPLTTTVTVAANAITGNIAVNQYITDSTNLLPRNAIITDISGTTTLTLTVSWSTPELFTSSVSSSSLVMTDTTNDNYALFEGSRVVFANDTDPEVKNKIYVSRFSTITGSGTPVITLTPAEDGVVLAKDQTVVFRGYNYQGQDFYFDGEEWLLSQQKTDVNQPPLFDVFDENGISFGDSEIYVGTSFIGNKLFAYGIGAGIDDTYLGFPIRYSSIDNVGDISFDVSLNLDTFDYVRDSQPITQKVNTGYVYNYSTRTIFEKELGWQTAVADSTQYQVFQFPYVFGQPSLSFTCDIAKLSDDESAWPTIQVFNNNNFLSDTEYTVETTDTSTVITLSQAPDEDTVIEVLLLSDQVSSQAYYTIPVNLSNNPLNADLTTADLGDIRGHYQSIFYNNPDTTGPVFGANNYRDLGNLVPYGTRIIQNSASLVLPGLFFRNPDHNVCNALLFNSRQYITFKTLLVDTINKTAYEQRYNPAEILDNALDVITSYKVDTEPFFWSDMIPSKAAFITNTYSFANSLDVSIYPLSRIYNFSTANYYGVLVYLTRTVDGLTFTQQLIKDVDYVISSDSPSLTVTLDLLANDQITIKEYNQTYGSYVPNTPTKLGLYPAFVPEVILDSAYTVPTYFIRGHDGSYTKLYGDYIPETNTLIDFRDQGLLEFEKRVYNNLKLSSSIPINFYDVIPGFSRETDYTWEEILQIYTPLFLTWIGENRIDYKTQLYNSNNQFTYNYSDSGNKVNKEPIKQGYWRGVYSYFYDSVNPNTAPWELIGYSDQPSWWTSRYGSAPYTSDNLVLWNDLAQGIDYNNGSPRVLPQFIRPELLEILPVDSNGNLLSPFDAIVGNYNGNLFQRDWKVGDDGPAEFSYRRSSSYPFDLMHIYAVTQPAKFFNLGVDLDNYKYNSEFNQYLVNDRSHLIIDQIEIYGSGIAKTSYINWVVDYEKQLGVDATSSITSLLNNVDVRLVYRLAGFSDKTLLNFYVEKGTPNSRNASLLIPDESYSVLLYDNQPFDKIVYSGVIIQKTNAGYKVYGNSQTETYFRISKPQFNGKFVNLEVEGVKIKLASEYSTESTLVPYGYQFGSIQEVSQFLMSYGKYLEQQGMKFDQVENGIEVTWQQMVLEAVYWSQTGWEVGSIININPSATQIKIEKDSHIVQPLTLQQTNFILNQNLYPIQTKDLNILRDETLFDVQPLNPGDTLAYGQFNISNFEHGIVFDNVTLFDDVIYNLTTGLRQNRILLRGAKTAEWNGTVTTSGFILNQDNILEWEAGVKYTKGAIVKFKNKYWTAIKIIQAKTTFDENDWKVTDYNEIQKGLLPNSSTRSYESTLYFNCNKTNLERDGDLLAFSLIGYRPRDYLALADLTDITQINVYKNMIKMKGTRDAANAFKGATLSQGGINYDIYENWAIKSAEFGGVLNDNFVEFKINEKYMTGNPSIVGLTNGIYTDGVQQEVPIYSLFNYSQPISNPSILTTIPTDTPDILYPSAGYVNYDDIKMSAYYYANMPNAVDKNNQLVPISNLYVRDYVWLADYLGTWQVYTPASNGQVLFVKNNLNGTATIQFSQPHNLNQYGIFAIVNFNINVDGYYVVQLVVDPYRVVVNLNMSTSIREISGQGTALIFQDQRVAKPSEINDLNLLGAEFTKNKVWVDTNTDGSWAVYRKSLNYQYEQEFLKDNTQSYGSAVAYTDLLGYLIGDADDGAVYRYTFSQLSETYTITQTLTSGPSFGTTIAHEQEIFVISEPTGTPKVHVYELLNTIVSKDLVVYQTAISRPIAVTGEWGTALALSGDKKWLYISAYEDALVYVYRLSQLTDEYEFSSIIDGTALGLTGSDRFGYSITTDYYGDTVVIGAPNEDYSATIDNWGRAYVYYRSAQNFEAQYTSIPNVAQPFALGWSPSTTTITVTATTASNDRFTCSDSSLFAVDEPVLFSGTIIADSNVSPDTIYYVYDKPSGTTFRLTTVRGDVDYLVDILANGSGSMTMTVQDTPLFVSVNGTLVEDNNYGVIGSIFYYTGSLLAGDIVNVSGSDFTKLQTLTTETMPRVGVHFGQSLDTTAFGMEIIVGAPFELNDQNQEGAAYRFTNGGERYGLVTGTSTVNVTSTRILLINGFSVTIPAGNAAVAANVINASNVSNIQALANSDGTLTIQLIDSSLAQVNNKLSLTAFSETTLNELGINLYTQTQVITCPHVEGPTQFGSTIKYGTQGSVVISAPTGTRYSATTFDFTDDENLDNDTVFDNNATQFVDTYPNAGAVYMFDYLSNYNENLSDTGKYVYAQSVNARNETYGLQPYYGHALDFYDNHIVIGTPEFNEGADYGQVVSYQSTGSNTDWEVFRQSSLIVDIDKLKNIQLFSAETNQTLEHLDYIDPLQGKILGSVRQNIDVVSNTDPAYYTNSVDRNIGLVWAKDKVGQTWLNTSNMRYVNYHQADVVYNSKYWATLFPGSDPAVYTWIESNVTPDQYTGPGIPYDITSYTTGYIDNNVETVTPLYYFWVRNTRVVYTQAGKTLADSVLETYILNPKSSGIAYFAPILPNVFGLYNSQSYINANDSVLHIGYSTGSSDVEVHNQYSLIRSNYADDFLPGLPGVGNVTRPESLYDRMLDSLSGVDEDGNVVPNPYLPKAVQLGILARPRQSFFLNRFTALKNYFTFANTVLQQYPISEIRQNASFLFAEGEFYNTSDYWEYINWWATGYDNNTKSAIQVSIYADLLTLSVSQGTIARVEENGDGKAETYIYQDGSWIRIGLENGTIRLKDSLWDYAAARTGYGDNFFDTDVYDFYPSEETRYIIRALNEQIYVDELALFRNTSLILLFEYIQSETTENQNYLPWLNKTSLIDVSHTIRELLPLEVFQSDNQDFLSGYLNEIKPYHVVIKDFLFKYTGEDIFEGDITDFDLPAQYNFSQNQFITPQLVYSNPNGINQYTPDDSIWQDSAYRSWFENYGVSITGQDDVLMTTLASYMTLNSPSFVVDNANGFPINGIITIGTEDIGYSSVDRNLNVLTGLTRGLNGTTISTHLPGEQIYMNLPAVTVLNGGRGYSEPPKVTAYIDTSIYPEPRQPAILQANMDLDTVLSVTVIDPGSGYAVLPEIVIDPSITITFASTEVSNVTNTITLYAPLLQTGDLVKYVVGENSTKIGGLESNQWYYINVLETVPTVVVALYTNYSNAINDEDRVVFYTSGTGANHQIQVGARATSITSAAPVRENNIALRFDRTSYTSQVIDWESGRFYGAFYAGTYSSEDLSSSSVLLDSEYPPIDGILASNQGLVLQITDVDNDQTLTWSSFVRTVGSTIGGLSDIVRLSYSSTEPNASGSTIGFYVGMPVKFIGAVSGTNLVDNQTYYVHTIVNDSDFKITDTVGGSVYNLNSVTIGAAGLSCYVGEVTNVAVLTVNYPGLMPVTATSATNNALTIPRSVIGTGGTAGFYTNLPIFFTDTVFGGIIENEVYYITTVIDEETFTISETQDPLMLSVTNTTSSTNVVTVTSTEGLSINEPIIFTGTTFGGITAGTVYYVSTILSLTTFTISTAFNGPVVTLTTASGNCMLTSQADVVQLTTATGNMTINVNLPVSPGQVDGQRFSLYQTSQEYPGVTGTEANLIERTIEAAIGDSVDILAINTASGALTNVYVNMPLRLSDSIGGLSTSTTYYVKTTGVIEVEVTNTSSSTNRLTTTSTAELYVGMSIVFSGNVFGNVSENTQYYIKTIDSATQFTISTSPGGSALTLTTSSGTMTGTGETYIQVATSIGGSVVSLSAGIDYGPVTMTQYPNPTGSDDPEFAVSYVLGGYSVIVTNDSSGYAVTNMITILGTDLGGTSPANDLQLTINEIGTNGQIESVIVSGTPAGTVSQYYLKVISANQFEVYSNQLLTVPVSGIGFNYQGFTTTTVTGINSSTDALTVTSTSGFVVNDKVIFSGNTSTGVTNITAYDTYYVYQILSGTTLTICTTPGDASTIVNIVTTTSVNFTMAKEGSAAYLPEPFYFNQSIVKYNNRVYVCVISNNDDEFIFGKWQLLVPGDRRLNALDRIIGYYQPTENMPGVDLSQLLTGITYPNPVYLDNPFEPDQQFAYDTILTDQEFYPTEIDIKAIVYDGSFYLGPADSPTYTAIVSSPTTQSWSINTLSNPVLNATDIIDAGGLYVITTNNSATPIYRSNNGIDWTTNGQFTPYGYGGYDDLAYDITSLNVASLNLNSVAYGLGKYIAVGENIVSSTDTYSWVEKYEFTDGLTNNLFGVTYANETSFNGFVAVGSGQEYDYSTGFTQIVPRNVILTSSNGEIWNRLASVSPNGFYAVAGGAGILVAVGENNVKYYSQNGSNWLGLNETEVLSVNTDTNVIVVTSTAGLIVDDPIRITAAFSNLSVGTTYYVQEIVNSTQIRVSATAGGLAITLTDEDPTTRTWINIYPAGESLNDLIYANSIFMAVGDNGFIETSIDGITWTIETTGTTENLNGITYNSIEGLFVVVGDNNTIIQSADNGATWTASSVFVQDPTVYDVVGNEFQSGYGPEELVPGFVSDNLTMIVNTRPGTNWDVTEYAHVGYNVFSLELTPTSALQTTFSFAAYVQTPALIYVAVIDGVTGLSSSIYEPQYSVDWVNFTITLSSPLTFTPVSDKLRLDIYEVGNGDQLVKSNSETDPIRENTATGFSEIYLNCNYSDTIFNGGGVIRPGTEPTLVTAIETDSVDDTILCDSVEEFLLNSPIKFQGAVFGGIQEDTTYYVKTISTFTNRITVSTSYNISSGTAGPTYSLTDATGLMTAIIQTGSGLVWSDPFVYHNGSKLVWGIFGNATRTKDTSNRITVNTTSGLAANDPITFATNMFGGIASNVTYYIKQVVDDNEITISSTPGGAEVVLTNATGSIQFITNDFAVGIQPNSTQAKLVFVNQYVQGTDYLVYSVFGETTPDQYGYTIPTTQIITSTASNTYPLTSYLGGDNAYNAIVEVDGVRQTISQYDISVINSNITFNSPPAANAVITITTYNLTDRQYLNTQYGITGTPGAASITLTIGEAVHEMGYDALVTAGDFVIGESYVIVSVGTTDFTLIGAASNTVGEVFTATGAGTGTGTAGAGYGEDFSPGPDYLELSSGSTSSLNVNDTITFSSPTIGGLTAGVTYYVVEIIDSTKFAVSTLVGGEPVTLTTESGSMTGSTNPLTVADITGVNNTITPPLAVVSVTATDSVTDFITCDDTSNFVIGQTIIFKGTSFGGISTNGIVYFIKTVESSTEFTIMDETGTLVTVTTDTGLMSATVGGTPTVTITTGQSHNFSENEKIRMDGLVGADQLNNNVYYAHIISSTVFEIYTEPYDPAFGAVNYPVTTVNSYVSGGYVWKDGLFTLITTTATASSSTGNVITVDSTSNLELNTPVIFTEFGQDVGDNILGGIIYGTTYYVKEVLSATTFRISATRGGDVFVLTNDTGSINVTQWEQTDVDRLWVTVNGYRLPSSKLRLNSDNNLSILTTIVAGDEVIITSMIPSATPNEEVYLLNVNQSNEPAVYRANTETRTWLTRNLDITNSTIYVYDVSRITDVVIQNNTTPAAVDGKYYIGLTADKNIISSITVFNATTGETIDSANFRLIIEDLAPILEIDGGSYITAGDELTITVLEGNLIMINGEQIKFTTVNFENNTISGLQRGANGTSANMFVPSNTEVYSLLSNNRMTDVNYSLTWNSDIYNTVQGDPLQISITNAAEFLRTDVT